MSILFYYKKIYNLFSILKFKFKKLINFLFFYRIITLFSITIILIIFYQLFFFWRNLIFFIFQKIILDHFFMYILVYLQ